jgi:hypothetical protein
MSRGGHFAALEQPELLAADIRQFAKGVLTTDKHLMAVRS